MQAHGPAIVVRPTYPKLAFGFGLLSPVVTVDGRATKVPWNQDTPLPVAPGVHDVRVHVAYLWEAGKAQLTVDNRAGHPVQLFYAAPYVAFSSGALGTQPVESPDRALGLGIFYGSLGLLALMVLCTCGMFGLSLLGAAAV